MIKKLISGGQTGADRAALDVAIRLGIPYGGWIPKGRKTEDGRLPDEYELQEMPTTGYPERTERNVVDSDGTVIISHGRISGGSLLTFAMAERHNRPCLHIDLNKTAPFTAAQDINNWIQDNDIEILNIAGPRAGEDPLVYGATERILHSVVHLNLMMSNWKGFLAYPHTVDEAVRELISEMPIRDKAGIANMKKGDLVSLHPRLGRYIRDKFRLMSGNSELITSCAEQFGKERVDPDEASAVIIEALWKELKETHAIRVVK